MRILVILWLSIAHALIAVADVTEESDKSYSLDIPQAKAEQALKTLSRQTGYPVIFQSSDVTDIETHPLKGRYTLKQALTELFKGTALSAGLTRREVITISRNSNDNSGERDKVNTKKNFLAAVIGLFAGSMGPQGVQAQTEMPMAGTEGIEEIIVTAQKRVERLQDVPVPVTAVSGSQLADGNRARLEDYYAQIPGFALQTDVVGPMVSIRGIAPVGFGNPTVGFMIDDVPTGASTSYGGGFLAPEVDPGDVERIEVLRGPQGTLYGASSMGGLVKYVTVSPSTDELSGRIQTGSSNVQDGDSVGYNVSSGLNVPVSDSFAVRVSGFRRNDPGYIENIRTGDKGMNEVTVTGGLLSTLWEPSSQFSLKLNGMLQRSSQDGSAFASKTSDSGDLQQDFLPNADSLVKEFEHYSATINAELANNIQLVSVTGYAKTHTVASADNTDCCGPLASLAFPTMSLKDVLEFDTKKLSSELRLAIPFGDTFEWLVGAFYTDEKVPKNQDDWIATDYNGQTLGLFGRFLVDATYTEKAGFTNLTYHVTDRLDLQIGGRYSRIDQTFSQEDSGPVMEIFSGESPVITPTSSSSTSASTYLFTPRFQLTPDVMLYGRFASGYRAGGSNPSTLVGVGGVPSEFEPDKTLNYEVGVKGDALDRTLQFDASVYYIDWKNIQIGLVDPTSSISYYTNGASAESQGVELSVQAAPAAVSGLHLGGWVAWNDATLTRDLPPGSSSMGFAGDRLPATSRFSGNLSVDYDIPVGQYLASFGWTMSYVDDRLGDFTETGERQVRPSYLTHDLRVATELNEWNVDLYFNNVTDRRGMVGGGIGSLTPSYFEYIRPRTIGLSVSRMF